MKCSRITCNDMGKDFGLQKTDYDVLEHMAAGSLLFQEAQAAPIRYRLSCSNPGPSVRGFRRLLERKMVRKEAPGQYAISDAGLKALRSRPITPLEQIEGLELLEGLPSPRKKAFLKHFTEEVRAAHSRGAILSPEAIRALATAVLTHVKAGVPMASTSRPQTVPQQPIEEPKVIKSNSTGWKNQFRNSQELRTNRKIRHRS